MSGAKSKILYSSIGLCLLAGSAMAQRPGFRPVQVVSPLNLNPTVLRATNPIPTRFVPGVFLPPTIAPGIWGPTYFPGAYSPPYVVQRDPGRYLRQSNGTFWNPWTNGAYSPYTDTFHFPGRTYSFNPWTGNYTNWGSGAEYNPVNGTLAQPIAGGFYNPWLFR
jgi:hypothetical protein